QPAPLLLHGKSVNSVGTEIIGDKIPLPGFRQMPSRNDIQTAMFWLSGIQPSDNPLGTWCCHECTAGKSIVDSLSPCPIGQERLAPTVKLQAPRIDQTLSINFQLIILRSQLPNPASFKPPHSPGSLYVAIDIDGLVEIQQPFWAPTESMDQMVGVPSAKSGQHFPLQIRFAVAIGICQEQHFCGIGDIYTTIPRKYTCGHQQSFGKYGRFISYAVPISILENVNFVVGLFTRFHVGIDDTAGDPKPAI